MTALPTVGATPGLRQARARGGAPVARPPVWGRGPSARSVRPSLRGTVLAALGAITSLGCAAVIGVAATEGTSAPDRPAPIQSVPAPVARP